MNRSLTMFASRIHRFGPPEVISFEEIERPQSGTGEVLVRVQAAGVGPWDAWVRAGKSALPQPLPLTLGSDLAGVVETVGAGVDTFRAGDEVFGVTNARFIGAYAEYAVASAAMIAPKPKTLDYVEAAALPVVAVTALQMLVDHARIVAGRTVLVHGAGGSVGSCAVQIARAAGAHVVATAFSKDVDYVRSLGASEVIDVSETAFEKVVDRVDAVFDTIGGTVQTKSMAIISPGGILVSSVSQPDTTEASRHGIRAVFFLVDVTTSRLDRVSAMIDAGDLHVRVGAVLPLSEARQAHEMLDGLRSRPAGKIVLRV
ncbi:MAG TPA: NADP-dependent oxidoreductase [Candidatus Acidoferrales bacterium]|nr:NADP-dependent oxidoreductase [Candidatus Acidoferrales bacterium]